MRLFSNVWSENTALFERLMEIHSNSPKLYYGFKICSHKHTHIYMSYMYLHVARRDKKKKQFLHKNASMFLRMKCEYLEITPACYCFFFFRVMMAQSNQPSFLQQINACQAGISCRWVEQGPVVWTSYVQRYSRNQTYIKYVTFWLAKNYCMFVFLCSISIVLWRPGPHCIKLW